MPHVVQTEALVDEGVLNPEQATIIAARSRDAMLTLIVNAVLCGGIIAASLGFVFWIADALGVALLGLAFATLGVTVLIKGQNLYRMLGHAATLVGTGMLFSGAGFELVDKYPDVAGWAMLSLGALGATAAGWAFHRGPSAIRFSTGAVTLMGVALHLAGLLVLVLDHDVTGLAVALSHAYATALIAAAGAFVNVRLVTALAIVPFAQMLDTGTAYFHAAYVFYSPEPTLTILQMGQLSDLWPGPRSACRVGIGRHADIFGILAAVTGSLAFLVGSLWGDSIGLSYFRTEAPSWNDYGQDWQAYNDAYRTWEATFFHISEHVFTVVFALILIAGAWTAAAHHRRGLFNTAVTFLGIHAYTQVFETFSDEPMVYALGGLAAIPLAWVMWRLNRYMFAPANVAV